MDWILGKALMLGGVIATVIAVLWRAYVTGRNRGREEEKRKVDEARAELQEKYDEIDREVPDADRAYDHLRRLSGKD